MSKQQVKVIELVGHKLDPKAKYLFVLDKSAISREEAEVLYGRIHRLIGDNFAMTLAWGNPRDILVVHEILPETTGGSDG